MTFADTASVINAETAIRLYDCSEGGDVLAVTTLGELWADNEDGFDESERTTQRLCLRVNGVYYGGGGADAVWRIEVA